MDEVETRLDCPGKVRVVDPKKVSEIVLGPLEDGSSETLVIKIPLTESKFYLVENRQPIGSFDPYLPGKGVLIMYADDSIEECRYGKSPVKLMMQTLCPQSPGCCL